MIRKIIEIDTEKCTAYAYAGFHQDFIRDPITLVGCPKLDRVDYSVKLEKIIRSNDIRSVTVVQMEVLCCGGIELVVKKCAAAQRQTDSLECGNHFHGWKDPKIVFMKKHRLILALSV